MSQNNENNPSDLSLHKDTLDNDESIFQFIKPDSNDALSNLSGLELLQLITLIDKYYIHLRSSLQLEKSTTFGVEIEFENADTDTINEKLLEVFPDRSWRSKYDGSLRCGGEIASPVLRDNELCWNNLYTVCSIVEPHASIEERSGGHIHIGAHILGLDKQSWLNFLKIWAVYENVIFRFTYGEFLTARPSIYDFAPSTAKLFWKTYQKTKMNFASLEAVFRNVSETRYQAVNFNNIMTNSTNAYSERNTVEFRCPNGTLIPAVWQNNVNFLVKLLNYCKSKSFDDDLIQKRYIKNSSKFMKIDLYDEIYLEQALELCDMIFDNNLDKIYFLRQYLKSYQIYDSKEKYPRANTLAKKGIVK